MPAMPRKPSIYRISQSDTNVILRWARPPTTNGPLKNYDIEMVVEGRIGAGTKKVWTTQVCTYFKYHMFLALLTYDIYVYIRGKLIFFIMDFRDPLRNIL